MDKKLKIYWNKRVFVGLILFELTFGVAPTVIIVLLGTEFFTIRMNQNVIGTLAVFGTCGIVSLIGFLISGTDAHMIFVKDGIEFRKWFHKPEFHPYKHYPYIQKAYYMYYGMPVYYIVLSNWRLTEAQRTAVNWGPASVDCIKIRYRKKQYEALLSVVPPEVAAKIRAQFQDVEVSKLDFLIP